MKFVAAAERKNGLSIATHKALESKFARQVARFRAAKSTPELALQWDEALARGEIAGGLWALLTHALCSEGLRNRAYEEIHMLSHQIGAGLRADLKRLSEVEDELRTLHEKAELTQRRHRQQLAARDKKIRELETALAEATTHVQQMQATQAQLRRALGEAEASPAAVRVEQLRSELAQARKRLDAVELENGSLRQALRAAEKEMVALGDDNVELAEACSAMERLIGQALSAENEAEYDCDEGPDLAGRRILCVGGRVRLVEQYRDMVMRCNGQFEHHDGGLEDNRQRLDALLSAADAVVCATDSVSHDAYYRLKRFCKRAAKPHVFMRSSGISSFSRALLTMASTS